LQKLIGLKYFGAEAFGYGHGVLVAVVHSGEAVS